jgi:hypothetical protein
VTRSGHSPVEPSATFRMNLGVSGISVSGTAAGEVNSGGGGVLGAAGARPQSAAVVTGIATAGPFVATGTIDGVIMIDEAGCSNNGHRWALDQLLPPTHR